FPTDSMTLKALLLLTAAAISATIAVAEAAYPVCSRQLSSCSCQTAAGGTIDLSPLAKAADFAFSAMGPQQPYNYLYNPCTGQRCDSSQGDAASCQRSTDRRYEYLLGTQSTAQFSTEPQAGLQLTYSALSGDGKRRSAQVQLVCDQSASVPKFEALDDGSVGPQLIVYKMRLTSKHCCEQSGGGGGGGGGGLSGGDILLIVFFCLVFVYVAGGLAFNALVRKLPVYPDSVPNREFWLALPFLVRDGCVFSFNGVRSLVRGRGGNSYENI
ncbi:hypothetical protein BOX15_Mlig033658g1, partial [Macrostomum lignano]